MNKAQLFERGARLLEAFSRANSMELPVVRSVDQAGWHVNACAYYRPTYIAICVPLCAAIGTAGRAWSYPGWTVDRTPYGVLAHELGHHVDLSRGKVDRLATGEYFSDFSKRVHGNAGEAGISSYGDAADPVEWFAESFRLFVTNPGLLQAVRPRTYREITAAGFVPALSLDWRAPLADAPARTRALAARRVDEARASGLLL